MKFNNPKFEQELRNLFAKNNRELTSDDDLLLVEGILIAPVIMNSYGIPWQGDSSAFKMKHPNLFITWDMVDWDDLARFKHINVLHAYADDGATVRLEQFTNLINIHLVGCAVDDWQPLESMSDLEMLYVRDCGNEGNRLLVHAGLLRCSQLKKLETVRAGGGDIFAVSYLNHMCLVKMGITDISPVNWQSAWTDVNLSHNNIDDIGSMADSRIYYLTLRHNKIKDVSALRENGCYLINLRHNQISDITPILDSLARKRISRLFLNYNPIQREHLEQLEKIHFILDDFADGESVRSDFTYGTRRPRQ
jgi:hypothetical protein